jgi:tRNA pseudouridine13 synthase
VRIKTVPEDFRVEERIDLPLDPGGVYTLYRIEKRGVTTPAVERRLARALHRRPAAVHFPGLKDKRAVAVQYVTVKGGGPEQVSGRGFTAQRMGRSAERLRPADLVGNRFTVTVRDLDPIDAAALGPALVRLSQQGVPNYFDQQRFGSQTRDGDLPGKRIFQRDAEGALHAHLAERLAGDRRRLWPFKRVAAEHWEAWDVIFDAAPSPSNFRSVLTYLRDHPTAGVPERDRYFRRALDLVTTRVLRLYIQAYQSLLWNRIVARYLARQVGDPPASVPIAQEALPFYTDLASRVSIEAVPLPYHRARYRDPDLAAVVKEVLREEGFELNDLKPRILERAYLPRGSRPLLLFPADVSAGAAVPDERFAGRHRVTLTFTLPPGAYATLVIKAVAALAV